MDAFEVLQTNLGPALQALEQGNRNRLQAAMIANQRAYEQAQTESARSHNRLVREEERQYTEQKEKRHRTETKKDAQENRLRELQVKVRSLGGKLTGDETEGDLAAMAADLGLERKIKETAQLSEGEVRTQARMAGISEEGRPISDVVQELAKKKQDVESEMKWRGVENQVTAARNSPDWDTVKSNLALDLAARQQALEAASSELPALHMGLSEEDKATLGQLYAANPEMAQLASKVPGGAILLSQLRRGEPGAYDRAVAAMQRLPEEDRMAFQNATMSFATTVNGMLKADQGVYSGELQAYLKQISALPQMLRSFDERIQARMNDPVFGPALSRENQAQLLNEYRTRAAQTMPGTKQKAAPTMGRGGPTALPGMPSISAVPGATAPPAPTPTQAVTMPGDSTMPVYGPPGPESAYPVPGLIPTAYQATKGAVAEAVNPLLGAAGTAGRETKRVAQNAGARLFGGYITPKATPAPAAGGFRLSPYAAMGIGGAAQVPQEDPTILAQRLHVLRLMQDPSYRAAWEAQQQLYQ